MKNSIRERAKRNSDSVKKRVAKAALGKSPIKQESSFTGCITEHKDGSVFAFIDIQNKDGNETKSLSLSKEEVRGLKKFLTFLDL